MAKQLGLDQAFRKRGAVYTDKRLVPPRTAGDDGLRHQFFAGPALAANQHIDVALGHAADSVINQPHRVAAADQLAKRISAARLFPQPGVFDFRGPFFQRRVQDRLHFLKIHRSDKAMTDSGLLELTAGALLCERVNPSRTRFSSRCAQLADQLERLLVGGVARFPDRESGLRARPRRASGRICSPEPKRVVWKAEASTSCAASCTDSSVVTTAMRGAAPVGIVSIAIKALGERLRAGIKRRNYRSIFHHVREIIHPYINTRGQRTTQEAEMLAASKIMGFVPTKDSQKARAFYEDKLGFQFVSDDPFALVVKAGETMIRVAKAQDFTPAPYTVMGWEVSDIEAVIDWLQARGVAMEKYPFVEDRDRGIWTAPTGDKVAWFKDPDGNVLSVSQHV